MAASVYKLFPGSAAKPADPVTAARHPLMQALSAAALDVLRDSLRHLFESADDLLFEMGEKAANDAERRRYFDTMRVLRLESGRVTQTFEADFIAGFVPPPVKAAIDHGEFDLETLAIQPTEELEERIAITNLAAKAEGLYKNAIWEVERRLHAAVHEHDVGISPQALSPARICEAFGVAIGQLDTEFQIKLVIYKLLDRSVFRDFERLYAAALTVLDQHGFHGAARRAPIPVPAASSQSPNSAGQAVTGPAPALPPGSSPAAPAASIAEVLRRFGLEPERMQQTQNPAAHDLGRLLQGLLAPASVTPDLTASAQRLSMAARLIEEMLGEPLLPEAARPAIESLRYPVYQSALTDASFFADTAHPLRRMLSDLVDLAVGAQTGGTAMQSRLRDALKAVATIAGSPASADTKPAALIDAPLEVDDFLKQMHEQTRARREALLLRVRRQVAQELEVQTLGRDVPAQVMSLLRGGVGPLMAVRLLRNGRGSSAFQDAHDLLERILQSLEYIPPPPPFELQSREELMASIVTALSDVGMNPGKVEVLLNGLQEVYSLLDGDDAPIAEPSAAPLTTREEQLLRQEVLADPDGGAAQDAHPDSSSAATISNSAAPAILPTVTVMELLGRVLAPETWYRVYDADQNQTRWLKLASFYPQQDSILFSGFDESNRLRLRAQRFASDLARGFSEPINPGAAAREALEQLRAAKSRGVF